MTIIRLNACTSLAAAALLGLAFPASAAETTSAARPAPEASQQRANTSNGDRRICVRLQQGASRITRPVCKTAQEWERSGGVPDPDR